MKLPWLETEVLNEIITVKRDRAIPSLFSVQSEPKMASSEE